MNFAALVNGDVADSVPVTDRGLHYGDGVFRTIRVVAGKPCAWRWYMQALARDAKSLRLEMPGESRWRGDSEKLFADGGDGVLKLVLTRGSGGRGYAIPADATPLRISLRYPMPSARPAALRLTWAETRLACQPALAGIKHLARAEQMLIASEIAAAECDEAIVRDTDGHPVCGGMSNLFVVARGRIVTPDLGHCGVAGVTRARIIDAAMGVGIEIEEKIMEAGEIEQADALYLSNSLMGLRPVASLDGQAFERHELGERLARLLDEAETAC